MAIICWWIHRIDKTSNKIHSFHKGLFMRCPRLLLPSSLTLLACLHVSGQLVVSVHSGVVHFSEGSVFIDDRPLELKLGTFPSIKEGSTLRTEEGRAEVLLTPGVFLRLDENSSIRMISNSIKDTRVEFQQGSAIVDSLESSADSAVAITYKDCQIRFPQKGIYRMDSEPPVLQAYNGEAEVTREGKLSRVDGSHLFFFSLGLVTQKFGEGADDDFYQWSKNRSGFISADNRSAAQSAVDPGQMDIGQATGRDPDLYLGAPSYGLGTPTYGGLGTPGYGGLAGTFPLDYNLGFSNVPFGMGVWNIYSIYFIYLPRYRHWPVPSPSSVGTSRPGRTPYPGLPPTRIGLPPTRIGISRGVGVGSPTFTPRPIPRVARPAPVYSHPGAAGLPGGGASRTGAPAIGRGPVMGHAPAIGRR
jgi:hypothetical protein